MAGTNGESEKLNRAEKAAYVREMFGRIAPRYQLTNHLMTGGLDRRWRRMAVREAALPPGGCLLDLATGTGDMAFAALKKDTHLAVFGVDFAPEMMRIGQRHPLGKRVHWYSADALRLPFPDHSFDAVTSAFLIRNLLPEDVLDAFREQVRVTKPGGRVVCLDAVPPPDTFLRPLMLFYLRRVIPLLGALVTGQRNTYTYLSWSVQSFRTPTELADIMESAGLGGARCQNLLLGAAVMLVGRKPAIGC